MRCHERSSTLLSSCLASNCFFPSCNPPRRLSRQAAYTTPAAFSTLIGTPAANAQTISTAEDTATSITLTGTDPNTPALTLTFAMNVNPAYGTLSGNAPHLTYTPNAGYFGVDSFQFTTSI